MQIQNNTINYQKDILNLLENVDVKKCRYNFKLAINIESKLQDLIKNNFSTPLDPKFIDAMDNKFYKFFKCTKKKNIWELFNKINGYIHAEKTEKEKILEDLKNHLKLINQSSPILNTTDYDITTEKSLYQDTLKDITFIKAVYQCGIPEIIHLFMKTVAIPPLSIFDNPVPEPLASFDAEKTHTLAEFNRRHHKDPALENKIMLIQRSIRGKIRRESEINRIRSLYSHSLLNAGQEAHKAMEAANTPYKPQKCSPELADRIINAASHVTLYSSITHLAATQNLAKIMDGCLYGRENLVNSHIDFRPAALKTCDIRNGDGNVICFGPNLIDPMCLQGKTVGMEFDLAQFLTATDFNKNPHAFFKQRDFGYSSKLIQTVPLKNETLTFAHDTSFPRYQSSSCINLQIYGEENNLEYCVELPKYHFISYNLNEIQKIWTLNFFKFLDNLEDVEGQPANNKIDHIYNLISQLNDVELIDFLTDLGRKMSCTSEFNFYGAHKIDLYALRSISFYKYRNKQDSIKIDQLCNELNNNCYDSIDKLKKLAPELLKSHRFVDFLISKIKDPNAAAQFKHFLSDDENSLPK